MFDAQEQWTVEYLNSLTREEVLANRAEQEAVALPVRQAMPGRFVEDWDTLDPVQDEIEARIDALRPRTGSTEPLLAEVRSEGFGSLTEFVFRDGITVDGHRWTFEEYVEHGSALDADLRVYCDL